MAKCTLESQGTAETASRREELVEISRERTCKNTSIVSYGWCRHLLELRRQGRRQHLKQQWQGMLDWCMVVALVHAEWQAGSWLAGWLWLTMGWAMGPAAAAVRS